MTDYKGWIQLHRKMTDNPLWTCEKFTRGQAWIDLLLLANHTDNYFYLREHKIIVKRGQVGYSQLALSERWKWSRSKVKKFLNDLEKEQQVVQHINKSTSIVTIVNYEIYQQKEQQVVQQQDNSKATARQQQDTNNNDNNDNNNNNKEDKPKPKKFIKPTVEQIAEYCIERKNNIDAERFYNHYESNGWSVGKNKMKDWKASVRTWERNNFNDSQSQPHTQQLYRYYVDDENIPERMRRSNPEGVTLKAVELAKQQYGDKVINIEKV